MERKMTIEHLPVAELTPYARNSRTHSPEQVEQIVASIREYGWTNPVLIDEHGTIIAGHGRVMAAERLGMERVPCIRLVGLTEAQKRAYVIADNKMAENAGWDEELLAAELSALQEMDFDLSLTGFSDDDTAELLAMLDATPEGNTDPDAVPEPPAEPVSNRGDIWLLGPHRLMCGDSTSAEDVARLMGGRLADCCWTDPPYNVAVGNAAKHRNKYRNGGGNTDSILNDDMKTDEFRIFLGKVYARLFDALSPGGGIYVAHSESERATFTSEFLAAGFKLSGVVIWRKDALVLGRSDYQWMHEPILYGWKPGAAHRWFGGRKQTTVAEIGMGSPFTQLPDGRWQVRVGEEVMIVSGDASVEWIKDSVMQELRPRKNSVHPTMKPVALIERMLRNSAKPGHVVLDLFGGSGSTLIACERLGMAARLMELDTKFADVIIRRWQDYTGKRAVHAETGAEFPA